MLRALPELPFVVILMGVGAVSMLVPAIYGTVVDEHAASQAFFYSAILFFFLFLMVALATSNMKIRRQGRSHLISMFLCFVLLPLMLAVPFSEAVPDTRFLNAYIEMVSSLTTTGMTLFEPERLPETVHLWRGLVAWMGGFFIWVTAIAIMAPLNLGGFEVTSTGSVGRGAMIHRQSSHHQVDASQRLRRFGARLLPVYCGLTAALWIALMLAGDTPFIAFNHAIATISTSGISPVGQISQSETGFAGELLILVFLVFALSRVSFSLYERPEGAAVLVKDPELRLGIAIIVFFSFILFLRHWWASFDEGTTVSAIDALRAIWGTLFTVASFLTTTGFESQYWDVARSWSGYSAPSVLLLGLAVFGGGVATTAGGVKLLRVYALYRHGLREMEKLVLPSSIGGSGQDARRFRRQGAYVAWVFFMLFALSIAVVMLALSLTGGLNFEETMILTISALSTTGPLTQIAGEAAIDLASLNDGAKGILAAAMILGRLETLAIIALLNPEFWR